MTTTLLSAGIACVIAAIVGGGLKAFGVEIPVLASAKRQAILAVFGCGLVIAAYVQYGAMTTRTPVKPAGVRNQPSPVPTASANVPAPTDSLGPPTDNTPRQQA